MKHFIQRSKKAGKMQAQLENLKPPTHYFYFHLNFRGKQTLNTSQKNTFMDKKCSQPLKCGNQGLFVTPL